MPSKLGRNPSCPKTIIEANGRCGSMGVVAASEASSSGSFCDYPEGHCDCFDRSPPRGALMREQDRVSEWGCQPWDPKVWADGCPSEVVSDGDRCSGVATCAYGDAYDAVVVSCKSGRWHADRLYHHDRPPPPPAPP